MTILEGQLGRSPRGAVGVAVACPFGFPAVIETGPYLDDGEPFPTLFYLTCPSARQWVSQKEAAGGVAALRRLVRDSSGTRAAFERLETDYRTRRVLLAGGPGVDSGAVLAAGIGGPSLDQATCLHAYAAALLAATSGPTGHPSDLGAPLGATSPDAAVWRDLLEGLGPLWCTDRRCARFVTSDGRRAAIDVGTNSVRLLVGDLVHGRPRTVVRRARVTRLGEGLGASKRFTAAARTRSAAAVAGYVVEARGLGAEFIALVGTSACREAEDGAEFVASLGREHAVFARVVSGDDEARLSLLGATLDIPGDVVLLDVGGGSTELVRRPAAGAPMAVSVDVGCVRATERWFTSDPPAGSEREAARAEARDLFAPLPGLFGARDAGDVDAANEADAAHAAAAPTPPAETLVGVAGTVTTLACLSLGLAEYDPEAIHLATLDRARLAAEVERLATMTAAERAELSCMQAGRADVIVAGGEILLAAMDALGWEQLTVSERDILDGILMVGDIGAGDVPGGSSEQVGGVSAQGGGVLDPPVL